MKKWKRTDTGYEAEEVDRVKVEMFDVPSLENLSAEEGMLMLSLLEWESENISDGES